MTPINAAADTPGKPIKVTAERRGDRDHHGAGGARLCSQSFVRHSDPDQRITNTPGKPIKVSNFPDADDHHAERETLYVANID